MERGILSVIPGHMAPQRITRILLATLALGLFLLAYTLSDLHLTLLNMDLALCDLRRKLGRMNTDAPVSSYTATVSLTPVTAPKAAYAPTDQTEERTENI